VRRIYLSSPEPPHQSILSETIAQIAGGPEPGLKLVLFVHNQDISDWVKFSERESCFQKISLIPVPLGTISYWIRDGGFLEYTPSENPTLFTSKWNRRESQIKSIHTIAQLERVNVKSAPIPIQGGNIIVSPSTVFVGYDSLLDAQHLGYCSINESIEWLSHIGAHRRKVIPVRTARYETAIADNLNCNRLGYRKFSSQPFFHIDFFLRAIQMPNGEQVVIVGDILESSDIPLIAHQKRSLDYVAKQIEANEIRVIRIPMPVFHFDSHTPYYLSYLNVLEPSAERLIYLPAFDNINCNFSKLDEAARDIWNQLEYTTYPITGTERLCAHLGGMRCASFEMDF
jgi:hypothetical protein